MIVSNIYIMRKIVSLISGIVLILLAYYISNEIASSKKTSKVVMNELSKAVYVEKVKNISYLRNV